MASNVIELINGKVSALATAIGTAVKGVKDTHAADKAVLEAADEAIDGRLDVVEPVLNAADFTGDTDTVKKYVDASDTALQGNIDTEGADRKQAVSDEADARVALQEQILGKDDAEGNHTDGVIDTVKAELESKISGAITAAYVYKGSVADLDALNAIEKPSNGDVYNVGSGPDAGNYAYVAAQGTEGEEGYVAGFWDSLGQVFDFDAELSDYSVIFSNAANATA